MRIFGIILACFGLIISLPLLTLVAILLRLDSNGPILFKQKRIGLNGKPFEIYKFRTMVVNAESKGAKITNKEDNRITKMGYLIRKFKLDEIPQLINIVRGDMAFVGPRPEAYVYKDLFKGKYQEILNYTPGIFGPNQIAFRNESEFFPDGEDHELYYRKVLFPQKAENDMAYLKNSNLISDITLIFKGVWVSIFKAKQ